MKKVLNLEVRGGACSARSTALRVQAPNYHILLQNLYYDSGYQNPKYLIIDYMDP